MIGEYRDGLGVAFADARRMLPRAACFPKATIIRNQTVIDQHKYNWAWCQACWGRNNRDPHHIIGGASRSDERTNLISLCRRCHEEAHGGRLTLGGVLWVKWKTARHETDWLRLTILRGSFLPDLICNPLSKE